VNRRKETSHVHEEVWQFFECRSATVTKSVTSAALSGRRFHHNRRHQRGHRTDSITLRSNAHWLPDGLEARGGWVRHAACGRNPRATGRHSSDQAAPQLL